MSLPVVVLYNVNRAALDIPDRIRKRHDFGQFTAYDGALNRGESNFRLFFEWFRLREDLENEIRLNQSPEFRDSQLDAVRKAIEGLVPGFSNPRVRRAPTQRMTVTKGDQELEISQLSDGEKCLMALVGDLARRLSIAQPQSATPLLGQGVALIDELELHLHPAWQREVVPALTRVFPGVQFILSTHSPQVLSELVADRVLLLEPVNRTIRVAHPSSTYGRDTNRILEDVMNVCDRPARIKEKIDALYLSLADDRFEDAATLLRDLEGTLGADEPELVRAGVLIKRKQATRQP